MLDVPGSQAGNGRYCGGNHLGNEGRNVLGISELFKRILKNQNMAKRQLLALKGSKAEGFALLHR